MRPDVYKQNNQFDFSGDSQLHHSQTTIAGRVGRRCIGNKVCGDGGLATHALLAYPKVKIRALHHQMNYLYPYEYLYGNNRDDPQNCF